MPDAAVAEKLSIPVFRVEKERQQNKIAPYKPTVSKHQWLPEQDALLGVKIDADIAILLGLSKKTVALRRRELGIPRQRLSGSAKGPFTPPSPDEIWTPKNLAKLGTTSDSLLAAQLKIHSAEVRAKREASGIPRFVIPHPHTREWSDEELALLGTMSDSDIAKKLGISRAPVANHRKKLGISRFRPHSLFLAHDLSNLEQFYS